MTKKITGSGNIETEIHHDGGIGMYVFRAKTVDDGDVFLTKYLTTYKQAVNIDQGFWLGVWAARKGG